MARKVTDAIMAERFALGFAPKPYYQEESELAAEDIARACGAINTVFLRDFENLAEIDLNKRFPEWDGEWPANFNALQISVSDSCSPEIFGALVVELASYYKGLSILQNEANHRDTGEVVHLKEV